jgi:steroid delta-isomerase-like uncharacterized protein
MSTQENKAIHRRCIEEIWNKGNLSVVDELIAADWAYVTENVHGREGYKGWVTMVRNAFPDWHQTIHDQVAEGDKVATRWIVQGTHQGPIWGIPPTGKKIEMKGMYLVRCAGGQLVEEWCHYDALGMLQQLGVIPAMG